MFKTVFILSMGCKISDIRGPIWMKLLGVYRVDPDTFHLDLKTGNLNFPETPTIIPCNIFLEISDFSETETFECYISELILNRFECLTVE